MSEWSRKLCERDAEWNTFGKHPSKENWDIYAKLQGELDAMGCCENMWVALASRDIVRYEDGTYHIYGEPMMANDGGIVDDVTETYLISYCPFCGKKRGREW